MSYNRFMYERFQARRRWRQLVGVIYVVASLIYLVWRATIINPDTLVLSLFYYGAEWLGFVLGLSLLFNSWNYRWRVPPPAPANLSVDVLVTVYREPLAIIRRTLAAAKAITYPHQTYVLDDGQRPEIAALAEELGIAYLCRGHNQYAKAGNLNYGLAQSRGEFVVTFDADHVPLPGALDKLLGFFADPQVAMVQTPQDFYNTDAFQYMNPRDRRGLWHDQSFFYYIRQPCMDDINAATCIGTGVAYRRSALTAIGGVPVETITEDMHTSLRLHKAGLRTIYLNEAIAYGVAESSLGEFYHTRHRWACGNLHALALEKPLTCKGLTMRQRLAYLTMGSIYLEGWQQLVLMLVPIISLLFGMAPFSITVLNVLLVLLFPLLAALLLQELGCGLSRYWTNEIYSMVRFPVHIWAWLSLLGGRTLFRSSSKKMGGRVEWRLLLPQIGVGGLSLLALGVGIVGLLADFQIGPLASAATALAEGQFGQVDWHARLDQGYTLELVVVAGFWALFNGLRALCVVGKVMHHARHAGDDYRVPLRLPALVADGGLRLVTSLSAAQATIRRQRGDIFKPGQILNLQLALPHGTEPAQARIHGRAGADWLIQLQWHDAGAVARVEKHLYQPAWQQDLLHRQAFFATPLAWLGRLLGLVPWREQRAPQWDPVMIQGALAFLGRVRGQLGELIAFAPLRPEKPIMAQLFSPKGGQEIWLALRQVPAGTGFYHYQAQPAALHAIGPEVNETLAEPLAKVA